MKRLIAALIALAGLIVGATTLRGAIAPDEIRREVETTLTGWLGAPVRVAGEARALLLPTPRLRWTDAAVTDASGATVTTAAEIEAPVSLTALLAGRIETDGLILRGARLKLGADTVRSLALSARLFALPPIDLRLENARVELAHAAGSETIETLDLAVAHKAVGAGLNLDGTARWRGEAVALAARLPGDAASPRWRVSLSGAGATLAADGVKTADPTARWTASTSLDVTDPGRLARLLGVGADVLRAPLRLEGALTVADGTATLADAALRLGRTSAKGSLALVTGGDEPTIGGTLAFDTIAFRSDAPLFGDGWRRLALARDRFGIALALRLSATELVTPRFTLTRPAMALDLAGGRLDAQIGDIGLWGKPASLGVVGNLGGDGLNAKIRAVAKELPAAELGTLFAVDGIEAGTVEASFEGATTCATLGACVEAISGRATIAANNLTVTGLSPFGDVTRFHPIVLGPKTAPKKTTWSSARALLDLAGHDARVDTVELIGNDARFSLKGKGDLARGGVELTGHAFFRNQRPTPSRPTTDEIRIPLRVHGTVQRLEITPAMPEQVPIEAPGATLAPIPIVPPVAGSGQ